MCYQILTLATQGVNHRFISMYNISICIRSFGYTTRKKDYRGDLLAMTNLSSLKPYPIATTIEVVSKTPTNSDDI